MPTSQMSWKKKTLEKSGLKPARTDSPSRSEALYFTDSAKPHLLNGFAKSPSADLQMGIWLSW